jgi:hypothetical protein
MRSSGKSPRFQPANIEKIDVSEIIEGGTDALSRRFEARGS